MISVPRIPAPAYLEPGKVAAWHNDLCDRRAQYYRALAAYRPGTGSKPTRPKTPDYYRHPDVRKALEDMFNSKCAYCEGEVAAVSPQHVEHYRPASRYPGLAYNWDNLLFACPHCNSTHKRDYFPIAPTGRTPAEHRRQPCSRTGIGELPLVLNPCLDTPEDHLTFRNGRVVFLTARGRSTRRICGLNRDGLITARRKWLHIIQRSAYEYKIADKEGDIRRRARHAGDLRNLVDARTQFAAMARAELDLLGIPWRNL